MGLGLLTIVSFLMFISYLNNKSDTKADPIYIGRKSSSSDSDNSDNCFQGCMPQGGLCAASEEPPSPKYRNDDSDCGLCGCFCGCLGSVCEALCANCGDWWFEPQGRKLRSTYLRLRPMFDWISCRCLWTCFDQKKHIISRGDVINKIPSLVCLVVSHKSFSMLLI